MYLLSKIKHLNYALNLTVRRYPIAFSFTKPLFIKENLFKLPICTLYKIPFYNFRVMLA